jgi:cyclopropane fatty-acyl-phospholipid synthase-like methyltransferase
MGSPYVPTRNKLVLTILKLVKPNKKTRILELGCGDGRFLRMAAKKYHASGLGIDINPVVLLQAKILAKIQKVF